MSGQTQAENTLKEGKETPFVCGRLVACARRASSLSLEAGAWTSQICKETSSDPALVQLEGSDEARRQDLLETALVYQGSWLMVILVCTRLPSIAETGEYKYFSCDCFDQIAPFSPGHHENIILLAGDAAETAVDGEAQPSSPSKPNAMEKKRRMVKRKAKKGHSVLFKIFLNCRGWF